MYNTVRMRKAILVLFLFVTASVWASELGALSLPPVAHVDTEVMTNIVISSWQRGAGKFSLACVQNETTLSSQNATR